MHLQPAKLHVWVCALVAIGCARATAAEGDRSRDDLEPGAVRAVDAAAADAASAPAGDAAADACIHAGEIDPSCPPVPPASGDCAQRAVCCRRSSNREKERLLGPFDPLVLEYRVQHAALTHHGGTIGGHAALRQLETRRYEQELQNLLVRVQLPRHDGTLAAGRGAITVGPGHYDCQGIYRYYGRDAAPVIADVSDDRGRWRPNVMPVIVDPSEESGRRVRVVVADPASDRPLYLPVRSATGDYLSHERVVVGFDLLDVDFEPGQRDCIGAWEGGSWRAGGRFVTYAPTAANDVQVDEQLSQTYCDLLAYGILPEGCLDPPPCAPDPARAPTSTCPPRLRWPDSLCPTTESEKSLWACHLGAEGNPNDEVGYPEALGCTAHPPAWARDPSSGEPSAGQCCDPRGESSSLPVCNAYRLIYEFVAAAVEIADEPSTSPQSSCE